MQTLTIDRLQTAVDLVNACADDPVSDVLDAAISAAEGIRDELGRGADGMKAIKELLEDVPAFLLASKYDNFPALDVASIAATMASTLAWTSPLRTAPLCRSRTAVSMPAT